MHSLGPRLYPALDEKATRRSHGSGFENRSENITFSRRGMQWRVLRSPASATCSLQVHPPNQTSASLRSFAQLQEESNIQPDPFLTYEVDEDSMLS
ncbi:hypothetical protein GQ600_4490 [Phytophthora cactorum]|nr:hypothetical protein GQ600_4490 [Phytophthora cactorum]